MVAVMFSAGAALGEDGDGQSESAWQSAFASAKVALRNGKFDEAISESARALKSLGDDPSAAVERARVLVIHGSALQQSGKPAEARKSLEAASKTLAERLPDSYELAVCSLNLAEVELDDGKFERADALSSRSLAIAKEWPREDPRTLTVIEGVCALTLKLGQYRPAAKGALYCLALRRRTSAGSDPMNLVRPLSIAAAGSFHLGDFDAAELCLREATGICSKYLGALHPATVTLQGNLLRTLANAGKRDAAEVTAKECEEALKKLASVGSANDLARLEFALGDYDLARGDRTAASKRVRAAERRLKAVGQSDGTDFADCELLLGKAEISKPDVALPAFQSAIAIYARVLGPSHPKSVLAELWLVRAGDSRRKDSLAKAKALLADLRAKLRDDHPDIVELSAWVNLKATGD